MNTIEKIAKEIANNRLIPFAGAGVSYSQLHVDWNEICRKMNDITGYNGTDNLDSAQQLVDKIGKEEFCNFLKNYFYVDNFNDLLGENHLFLMALNYARYYTTNQDNLFEKCFEKYHRPLNVISDTDDFENYNPKNQVLYKFHGALEKPETVVFCKNDYEKRMPNKELFSLNPLDIQLMADTIAKGILFIGYSFNDPNIKLIFEHIGKITKGHKKNFYLIEYLHSQEFVDYLKQYNIIAVNPVDFYPDLSSEDAYSKFLSEVLTFAYRNQFDFFNKNIFNDTTIIPIKNAFELKVLNSFLEDKNIYIDKKIEQFRQCYDLSVVPEDYCELYKNGLIELLSDAKQENLKDITGNFLLLTLKNFKVAMDCMKLFYKKLNTINIDDSLERIQYTSISLNGFEGIRNLNLFAQCAALEELLEENEDIDCLLSYIQMCMYSKQTLEEIDNEDIKEYAVDIFKKAYSQTKKYVNPFNQAGFWLNTKSYEDIKNSLYCSLPKTSDFR